LLNKNKNSYAILIIGIKSIIGYSKMLLNNYKKIFKKNKNISIRYLPKNIFLTKSNKTEKIIDKIIKNSKASLYFETYNGNLDINKYYNLFSYNSTNKRSFIKDYIFITNNGNEKIKIKKTDFNRNDLMPNTWYTYNKKKNKKYIKEHMIEYSQLLSNSEGKLNKEFNSPSIRSVAKIGTLSVINIWMTYCIINDISIKDNKLYKKFFKKEEYINPRKNKDYMEYIDASEIIDKIIKIKMNKKVIIIHNNNRLIDYSDPNHEYFAELDYLINNINLIMDFMIKCYPQQINKSLTKKLILKYSKNAFKIIKKEPTLMIIRI
jgi:hypothetical protein